MRVGPDTGFGATRDDEDPLVTAVDAGLAGKSMGGIQASSTGGGTGVETVLAVTSLMIDRASFVA
jgi:hypothetical protein